jgi:fused signal recognition particle receptor
MQEQAARPLTEPGLATEDEVRRDGMARVSEPRVKFLKQVQQAVARTRDTLAGRIENFGGLSRAVDDRSLEELQTLLLTSDMGHQTAGRILEVLCDRARQKDVKGGEELRALLKELLLEILTAPAVSRPRSKAPDAEPYVTFLVGVNGTGKTTTSGKLATLSRARKRSVILCAADTCRPAAIEQLQDWANRAGAEIVKAGKGSDPVGVVYNAISQACAGRIDELIVDTAGRMQTKANLMDQLDRMLRTAAMVIPNAPHEVLLVIDATTGQNGLEQARLFAQSAGVTGIVLTKLDGTAKGGIAVAIAQELNLPVRYMSVGEEIGDFLEFFPEAYIDSLLEDEPAEA